MYQKNGSFTINPDGSWQFYPYAGGSPTESGTNWGIPLTADAINKYNDEFEKPVNILDTTHPYQFDKKGASSEIGGIGKIVSYVISTSPKTTVTSGYLICK